MLVILNPVLVVVKLVAVVDVKVPIVLLVVGPYVDLHLVVAHPVWALVVTVVVKADVLVIVGDLVLVLVEEDVLRHVLVIVTVTVIVGVRDISL